MTIRPEKLIKALTSLAILLPVTACAQTPKQADDRPLVSIGQSEQCTISDGDRKALLDLDYDSFDQSLPAGGWRKYDRCPLLARELIDAYTARHASTLQKQHWDVLVWHSGQLSGLAGDYADAIAKMQQTLKPDEKATDAFLWNPYANATIAFLKKDKPALIAERAKLARGESPFNHVNLRFVDAFIRCFNSSYQEAYAGSCNPPETKAEKIRSLAVPVDPRKPLPQEFFGLRDFLGMRKVILVGEIHGTKTTPEIFGNLVASLASEKLKTLAVLEINQSSQNSIDEFLKTGDESVLKKDPFFARKYQDGRSSKAMVELLKNLAKLPNTTVLCMDPMEGIQTMTGQERDTGMAAFINAKKAGYDHTIVLSGNVHSSTALGTPWDKNYRPMGYELKSMATDLKDGDLLNILVRYGKVDAWYCTGDEASHCSAHYEKEILTDYSKAAPFPFYFVWENELTDGHNASLFVRSARVSLPFVHEKIGPTKESRKRR